MKKIEELYNGFFLTSTCANMQISGCKKKLRTAPIKKLKIYERPQVDYEHFAFAEKDRYGNIEYFNGLKNFLLIESPSLPTIFIFDNHNHALPFRYDIIYKQKTKNIELIHIDQHSDCWDNKNFLRLTREENELEKVFNFCNKKCNVGNFISPALKSRIISNQVQIRSITALKNLSVDKNTNFILDIDLDFCLDGIDRNKLNQDAIKLLKYKFNEIGKYTLGITIATSPYFINQELAINIIDEIFN